MVSLEFPYLRLLVRIPVIVTPRSDIVRLSMYSTTYEVGQQKSGLVLVIQYIVRIFVAPYF